MMVNYIQATYNTLHTCTKSTSVQASCSFCGEPVGKDRDFQKSCSSDQNIRTSDLSHSEVRLSAFFYLDIVFFVKTFQAFERLSKRQMAEALEVWKFLDYLMHYNTNVEYSALMQRQTITKSLQLVLIVACLASTGQ